MTADIKDITLDDYVRFRDKRDARPPVSSPFGLSRVGNFLNPWQTVAQRAEYYLKLSGRGQTADLNYLQVFVEIEEPGIQAAEEQPFLWDGKINEYAAELAVWRAYEILTEKEGAEFMKKNRPRVTFVYMENGRDHELIVRYDGGSWIIMENR